VVGLTVVPNIYVSQGRKPSADHREGFRYTARFGEVRGKGEGYFRNPDLRRRGRNVRGRGNKSFRGSRSVFKSESGRREQVEDADREKGIPDTRHDDSRGV